jgi:hypothetical protein
MSSHLRRSPLTNSAAATTFTTTSSRQLQLALKLLF